MADDEKTPAREVITDYAQAHFRYFRTPDGTVYAQKKGHPVARPIRSQGTTGSHRQELMVGLFNDGLGVFNGRSETPPRRGCTTPPESPRDRAPLAGGPPP